MYEYNSYTRTYRALYELRSLAVSQVVGAAVRAPEPALRRAAVRVRVLRAALRERRELSRAREAASAPRIEMPPLRRTALLNRRGSCACYVPCSVAFPLRRPASRGA